jgi:hypothetical protein
MAQRRTVEQRLADLEGKRNTLAEKVRATLTQEKIVIGAVIASECRENPDFAAVVKTILAKRVKRDADRKAVVAFVQSLGVPESQNPTAVEPPVSTPPMTVISPAAEIGPVTINDDPFANRDAVPRPATRRM